MDARSKEHLDKILEKSPGELNKDDIAFLRARRSYLKEAQKVEYKSVLILSPKGTVKKKNAKTKKEE